MRRSICSSQSMSTPFAMHWFISTNPDYRNVFSCFSCQRPCCFSCFSLACTNKPNAHLFCRLCATERDEKMDFSCPACLLRDEVDKCKAEVVDSLVDSSARLRNVNELREGTRVHLTEAGYVVVYREDVVNAPKGL